MTNLEKKFKSDTELVTCIGVIIGAIIGSCLYYLITGSCPIS